MRRALYHPSRRRNSDGGSEKQQQQWQQAAEADFSYLLCSSLPPHTLMYTYISQQVSTLLCKRAEWAEHRVSSPLVSHHFKRFCHAATSRCRNSSEFPLMSFPYKNQRNHSIFYFSYAMILYTYMRTQSGRP